MGIQAVSSGSCDGDKSVEAYGAPNALDTTCPNYQFIKQYSSSLIGGGGLQLFDHLPSSDGTLFVVYGGCQDFEFYQSSESGTSTQESSNGMVVVPGMTEVTGTAEEVLDWCRKLPEADRCCTDGTGTVVDDTSCAWSGTATISRNSCQGLNACQTTQGGFTIGENSCIGQNACQTTTGGFTIGENSCIGLNACQKTLGGFTIGENSCVGDASCSSFGGGMVIESNACDGLNSCFES